MRFAAQWLINLHIVAVHLHEVHDAVVGGQLEAVLPFFAVHGNLGHQKQQFFLA